VSRLDELYRRVPAFLMARRNLSRNRLRSALATLGIVIGVLAIAALGMFGTTLRAGATQELGDIGNELSVSPNFDEGIRELSDRDVDTIERVAGDAAVVPVKQDQRTLQRGRRTAVVTAYGMENPGALYNATDGRLPERFRQGVVVGSGVAERFELEAGNSLTVDNTTYRVAAVLEEQDGISLVSPNNAVILPPSEFDDDGYSQVVVAAESGQAASETADRIRESLNRREERVTVFELSSITDSIGQLFGIINAFLIGIGSISLVVAGVSILNVMLMSTVERRGEIGVLRAVGVQKMDVVRMILSEAALLGGVGGLGGAVLSILAGLVLNWFVLSDPLVTFRPVNLLYVGVAVFFGIATSVLSGLYPAWKAANEPPVEALRNS
jgi:putative ABC transport system permease protein